MSGKQRYGKQARPQREYVRPTPAERQGAASTPTSAPPAPGAAPQITRTVVPSGIGRPAAAPAMPNYGIIKSEMKRIAIIAGSMFAILIVLSFFLK